MWCPPYIYGVYIYIYPCIYIYPPFTFTIVYLLCVHNHLSYVILFVCVYLFIYVLFIIIQVLGNDTRVHCLFF